jgi:hypothetical protein
MRRKILVLLLALAITAAFTALLLEISLRVLNRLGIATPAERLTENNSFYRDENPAFGVWHPPNGQFRARGDCFEALYQSNDFGMRDRPRSLRSEAPRVAVLGDSFVEGVGVNFGARLTDVLEERTGIEHLNFGTAGGFSSIQQWKLYETLARQFDHERVLLFAFPNNDFIENDPERFWDTSRYRPYLRRVDGSFEVYYPIGLDEARARLERQLAWNRWYNRLFVYRLVAYLDAAVRNRLSQGGTTPYGYVGYELVGEEDLERLFFTYRQIRDLAAPRELVIFTIPRLNDLLYFENLGYPDKLPKRLEAFARSERGIRYFDLLPGFVADRDAHGRRFEDYFIPCDGHWNELGSRVAAEIVLESLREADSPEIAPAG